MADVAGEDLTGTTDAYKESQAYRPVPGESIALTTGSGNGLPVGFAPFDSGLEKL